MRWIARAAEFSFPSLAVLAVAALSGAWCAHLLNSIGMGSPWLWGTATVCCASVFLLHRGFKSLAAVVGTSYALMLSMTVSMDREIPHHRAMMAGQDFYVTATGVIDDAPRRLRDSVFRFPMQLESIREHSNLTLCEARILVTVSEMNLVPSYGDRLSIRGRLSIPDSPMNPGQFGMRAWFLQQGYSADLFSIGSEVSVLDTEKGNPFFSAALQSRNWIKERLTIGLKEDPGTASVIAAMVLGTRNETPDEIEDAFVGSGTMHVFAVSGLHVGLFGYMAWMFLKALGIRRPVAIAFIIPCLIFYAFVTGLRPSACRATIMAVIVLVGYLCDRVPSMPNSLGAAALIILAVDPLQILQPGFQLSFIVLGFIVAIAPHVRAPLQRFAEPDPFLPRVLISRWQRFVWAVGKRVADVFSVSLAAWLGSAFLMLHHFEIVTPIAIIANCFLVPCAFAILFTSCVSLILGTILGDLIAIFCNQSNWLIAKVTVWLATFFAGMPGGGGSPTDSHSGPAGSLEVSVLHLEEGGGCAFASVNGGESWFLDSGHASDLGPVIRPFLDYKGIEKIDAILLSHADSGHIGGAEWLAGRLNPERLVVSSQAYRSPVFTALSSSPVVRDRRFEIATAGREFSLGEGIVLRILYPPDGMEISIADDQALVVQLEHQGWRIMFMQDAGFSAESWLLENCRYLESDVLVKGVHRTDYSGLSRFLDKVNPKVIVTGDATQILRGQRRVEKWLNTVEARGITHFDQSVTGAVDILVEEEKLSARGFSTGLKRVLRR